MGIEDVLAHELFPAPAELRFEHRPDDDVAIVRIFEGLRHWTHRRHLQSLVGVRFPLFPDVDDLARERNQVIERNVLRQARAVGEQVRVVAPSVGPRAVTGDLVAVRGDTLFVRGDAATVAVPLGQVEWIQVRRPRSPCFSVCHSPAP